MSDKRLLTQIRDAIQLGPPGQIYNVHLTLDGSGVTFNAIAGASGVTDAFMTPSLDNEILLIEEMNIEIEDAGAMGVDDYGSINGGVSNGIRLYVCNETGAIEYEITDPLQPITKNVDWIDYTFEHVFDEFAAGNNLFVARWVFSEFGTHPIALPPGWQMMVILQDDFSGLVKHDFLIKSFRRPA
jgi:hypothetical protein